MTRPLKYNADQRREYLFMIDRIGRQWLDVFEGNTEFYSAVYWDLLTGIWKRGGEVRKTDAAKLMVGVKSTQTASKYVDQAIERGILLERENPKDARSRLVYLTPDMRERLDAFFDQAVDELRQAAARVEEKDTAPVES